MASCRLDWSPARRGGGGWGEAGGRDEGGECVPLEAETWRERERAKWGKEAADDSVRGAEAAAVKDTTWKSSEIQFQSGSKYSDFPARPLLRLQ